MLKNLCRQFDIWENLQKHRWLLEIAKMIWMLYFDLIKSNNYTILNNFQFSNLWKVY